MFFFIKTDFGHFSVIRAGTRSLVIVGNFFAPRYVHSWAHIGIAGSFGALLVSCLVVVVPGLYLARQLFTLCIIYTCEVVIDFLVIT